MVVQLSAVRRSVDGREDAYVCEDVEFIKALLGGDEDIKNAGPASLLDFRFSAGYFKQDAGSQDELVGLVIDKSIFHSDIEVAPTCERRANSWMDDIVAALGEHESEALRCGPAQLHAIDLQVAALCEEVIGQMLESHDRPNLGPNDRVFKDDGIGDRIKGAILPVNCLIQ